VVITSIPVPADDVADKAAHTPELIAGIKNGIARIPALFIGVFKPKGMKQNDYYR
jgi:hypothetical protein